MYKLLLFILMCSFLMLLTAQQTDEQAAMQALFRGKHAVNRAAHAAAQQIDPQKLKEGIVSIDPLRAHDTAFDYLQRNLGLDADNVPLPGTFWQTRVEVPVLEVINEDRSFPYIYHNAAYDYTVTLNKPGVIMIIRLEYPRTFQAIGPITWMVKGAAELVY